MIPWGFHTKRYMYIVKDGSLHNIRMIPKKSLVKKTKFKFALVSTSPHAIRCNKSSKIDLGVIRKLRQALGRGGG